MNETSPTAVAHPEPAVVLDRAAELERTDWAAAIDLLTEANHAFRSEAIEDALVALRHRSFPALAETAPEATWPTGGVAAPVGESGLPEATLAEVSAASLRASVLSHGALLVRGAVDRTQVAQLVEGIDKGFGTREAPKDDAGRRPRSPWWKPLKLDPEAEAGLGRKWIRVGGGLLLADSPRMMFDLLELYTEIGLRSIVTDYLGSRPVLSANKGTLRRVGLDATGGWHQDGAFLGQGIRAANIWLALTPCGRDAPGMDMVPRRFEHIVETGTNGSYFDWAAGQAIVEEAAGDAGIVRPEFEAGDLLIFDDLFLHKTAVEPTMTKERHAIESWFFSPTAYPEGHVPLVW